MTKLLYAKEALIAQGLNVRSFGDIGFHTFGKWGRWTVDLSILFAQLGAACAYYNFIGNNIESIVVALLKGPWVGGNLYPVVVLSVLAITIPLVCVRKINNLAATNLLADILIMLPLLYILSSAGTHVGLKGAAPDLKKLDVLNTFQFLGTAVYAMEGIPMIIPVESSARDKQGFPKLLQLLTIIVSGLQMSFATVCYVAYGAHTEPIITLNLKESYEIRVIVHVIKLSLSLAILFTIPLMMFPANKIVESIIFEKKNFTGIKIWKNVVRALLVSMCAGVAIGSRNAIDSLVSFVGALFCVPLALIYPALIHYKVMRSASHHEEHYKLQQSTNVGMLFVGLTCLVLATSKSISQWVSEYRTGTNTTLTV
jgi:proton-coupled amino acid transporter